MSTENLWEPDDQAVPAHIADSESRTAPQTGNTGVMGVPLAAALIGVAALPISLWVNWMVGLLLAIAAIVLGAIGLKRGGHKAPAIAGIVLGAVCLIAFGILVGMLFYQVSQIGSVLP